MEAVVLSIISSVLVNYSIPAPHMDEFFHIRQLEVYLKGDFTTWDAKITTLPGLYIFSYIILKATSLHQVFSLLHICRFLNSLLLVPVYILTRKMNALSSSLVLFFPPLWMSSFLYYTDSLSLLACLLSQYLRGKSRVLSFLSAVFAIFCRQTNVVWIGYSAGLEVFQEFQVKEFKDLGKVFKGLKKILFKFYFDLLTLAGFFVFVYVNKGVAVGDRDSHAAVPHFAQVCYLFLIGLLYVPFDDLDLKKHFMSLEFILAVPVFAFFANNFSFAHPYLLSDNSHYTFYIWKDVIRPYGTLLFPYYALGFTLMKNKKNVEFFWWLACSSIVLVPAHLLEPRYFITPLTFYLLLHQTKTGWFRRSLVLMLNLFTLAVFIMKPYKGISFMW